MSRDMQTLLDKALKVFPDLAGHSFEIDYNYSGNSLSNLHVGVQEPDLDPEALFLEGRREEMGKPKKFFTISVNKNVRKVRNHPLRRQLILHLISHHLLYVEKREKAEKGEKILTKRFHEECLDRFNKIRETDNIPPIKSVRELDIAISNILRNIGW